MNHWNPFPWILNALSKWQAWNERKVLKWKLILSDLGLCFGKHGFHGFRGCWGRSFAMQTQSEFGLCVSTCLSTFSLRCDFPPCCDFPPWVMTEEWPIYRWIAKKLRATTKLIAAFCWASSGFGWASTAYPTVNISEKLHQTGRGSNQPSRHVAMLQDSWGMHQRAVPKRHVTLDEMGPLLGLQFSVFWRMDVIANHIHEIHELVYIDPILIHMAIN